MSNKENSLEVFSYLKTDMYRSKDDVDFFCFRESDSMMAMYKQSGVIATSPIASFFNAQHSKFGLKIEHECHLYRNNVHMASGRYFRLMYVLLQEYMIIDQYLPPRDLLEKSKRIEYSIKSHSWGTLIKQYNYFNDVHQFNRVETLCYNYRQEDAKLKKAKNNKTQEILKTTISKICRPVPRVYPASSTYNGPNLPAFKFEDSSPMVRKDDIQ